MKSLADRLKLTRSNLFGTLFNKNKSNLNDNIFNELEDRFLLADIGVKTTEQIIQLLKSAFKKDLANFPLEEQLKKILISILKPVENNFAIPDDINKPYLILVVGVNGVGKTTTIGKLTKFIKSQGKSVLLAAADTFRAAATEQLKKWGELNNVEIISVIDKAPPK